jgi:hypothetical protein
MKKFNMAELKLVSTPISIATTLDPDENGKVVDQREYRSMIGSLLYLMVTRPDIQFAVRLCACFQASPRSSYRQAIQRIFWYLKTQSNLGFGIPLLHRLILLAFLMQILRVVELIALLGDVIFLDLLVFVALLANKLLLHKPSHILSM